MLPSVLLRPLPGLCTCQQPCTHSEYKLSESLMVRLFFLLEIPIFSYGLHLLAESHSSLLGPSLNKIFPIKVVE